MADQIYPIWICPLGEEEGGGYIAVAPDLPGCMSDGGTPEEAAENVRGAIGEWLDEMSRLGRQIPEPGSAAKAAAKERRELLALLRKQDELLRKQETTLNSMQQQFDALKNGVAALLERENEGLGQLEWPRRSFVLAHISTRTKKRPRDPLPTH